MLSRIKKFYIGCWEFHQDALKESRDAANYGEFGASVSFFFFGVIVFPILIVFLSIAVPMLLVSGFIIFVIEDVIFMSVCAAIIASFYLLYKFVVLNKA